MTSSYGGGSTSYAPGVSTGKPPKDKDKPGYNVATTNKAPGVSKSSPNDKISEEKSNRNNDTRKTNFVGKKYRDLSEKQQSNISKSEFRGRRESQRKAGDMLNQKGFTESDVFKVDKLKDYDASLLGKGGSLSYGPKGDRKKGDRQGQGTERTGDDFVGRGKNVITKSDVRGLMEHGGFGAKRLDKYVTKQEAKGVKVGSGVGNFLERKMQAATNNKKGGGGGKPDSAPAGTPAAKPAAKPAAGPKITMTQKVTQENKIGDKIVKNTGDINNKAPNFGMQNTGMIDYSVNIQGNTNTQSAGGGGGGEASLDPLANTKTVTAYKALNENDYERSRSKVTGTSAAATAAAVGETLTGMSDRIKGFDYATNLNSDYYGALADNTRLGLFGDLYSYKPPTWVSPGEKSKVKTDFDKD